MKANNKNSIKEKYPLISIANFKSYLIVLLVWLILTNIFAILLTFVSQISIIIAFVISLFAIMSGMMIMFVASAINLIKLRRGFERLAQGKEHNIPKVWCPVLTMATRASIELENKIRPNKRN